MRENGKANDDNKKFNDGINETPKVRLPLQGEADTDPRSLVLCGYPS